VKTSTLSKRAELNEKRDVHSLYAEITGTISGKTVVVGIGNVLRGDDGAGPVLINTIAGRISAECINAGSVPENYIEKIVLLHPQTIVLVDAADFYGAPGEIRLFNPDSVMNGMCSSHTGSLKMVTDYLQMRIRVNIIIIAIQAVQTQLAASLSTEVRQALAVLSSIFFQVFAHA
jgi:hydrogenase 3 maturation protease